MREIKFRAWDECRKRYFTRPKWVEFKVDTQGVLSCSNYAYSGNIQELIVEQYTGLKDCNGVEIYEGDILAITTDRDGSYMNKVEEYQGIFGFFNITCKQIKNPSDWDKPHNKTDSGWFLNGFSNLAGFDYSKLGEVDAGGNQACVKVIGNIHENPEILEGK